MLRSRQAPRTFAKSVDQSRYNLPSSPWFRDRDGRSFSAYEIEAVLEGVNGVSEVAVVRRRAHLRAYYTTVSGKPWPGIKERLRAAAREELAGREYMWPASYVKLTEMPYLVGTKKICREKLAKARWRRGYKVVEVPGARDPVSEWRFEGIIEAIPSRATLIIAHRLGGPQARPVRITISRENLSLHHRLNVGRWGVFEGYFRGEGGMMLTKFKLVPAPTRQISLDKVDAVFDAL